MCGPGQGESLDSFGLFVSYKDARDRYRADPGLDEVNLSQGETKRTACPVTRRFCERKLKAVVKNGASRNLGLSTHIKAEGLPSTILEEGRQDGSVSKAPASEPDHLSSSPRTHTAKKNQLPQAVS